MVSSAASMDKGPGSPRRSPLFRSEDIRDPAGLAKKLGTDPGRLSRCIWERLSDSGKERLRALGASPDSLPAQQALLTEELNRLLQAGDLCDPQYFKEIKLSAEARSLHDQALRGGGIVYRNRLLLEDAYPDEVARSPRRFAVLNGFLAEYAALPIDPMTAKALDAEREGEILIAAQEQLEPLAKRYISDLLNVPIAGTPWGGEIGKGQASRRQDDAIEALQRFWYVFLRRLRFLRSRGQSLEVAAGSFIHYWVRYALDRRGWSPTKILNETVDEYHHREAEENDLRDALSQYCRFLARDLSRRKLLGKEDCRPIPEVVEELLTGVVNGELLLIAPVPEEPGSQERNGDGEASSVHTCTPEYVNASFREHAERLLKGEPRPRMAEHTDDGLGHERDRAKAKVSDEGRFNAQKRILSAACAELAKATTPCAARTALRRLLALLFLPYYLKEQDFSEESQTPGASVQKDKLYWAELLTHEMSRGMGLEPEVQQTIIDLVKSRKRYHVMMAQFSVYNWLQCSLHAYRGLKREPLAACGSLNDFWLCSSGQRDKVPGRRDFEVCEVKGPPPPRLVYYGSDEPLEGLVLSWAESPPADAKEARP